MKHILGTINQDIIEKWYLDEYKDKKIVFYLDRKALCEEHLSQYKDESNYYYVMANLEKIIKEPDYVYYDVDKNGLEYYKNIKENILVAIKISNGNELKVRSIYPVTETKIKNRKKKEKEAIEKALLEKYRYKEIV